jgi:hypothetical protein
METISIELGLLFLVLFTMPVLYVIIKSAGGEKRVKKVIIALSKDQNLSLKNIEVIGNTIIGMDESHHNLVLSNRKNPKETFQIVPVRSITSCTLKTVRIKNKSLENVELELIGPKLKKEIVFYEDQDESIVIDAEACLHEVQKWERAIKKNLQLAS